MQSKDVSEDERFSVKPITDRKEILFFIIISRWSKGGVWAFHVLIELRRWHRPIIGSAPDQTLSAMSHNEGLFKT